MLPSLFRSRVTKIVDSVGTNEVGLNSCNFKLGCEQRTRCARTNIRLGTKEWRRDEEKATIACRTSQPCKATAWDREIERERGERFWSGRPTVPEFIKVHPAPSTRPLRHSAVRDTCFKPVPLALLSRLEVVIFACCMPVC